MQAELNHIPRVMIAGLRGGAGKTVVSIGIVSALTRLGKKVAPFKKGPDYIDAGWLAMAAGRPCHNLDPFLFLADRLCKSFSRYSQNADLSIIEGNRGLYDGLDARGTTSTASLAKILCVPVILCVDCTKATRTMAAVVLGCLHFDPDVEICGVVLNRVAGSRHEKILRSSIESTCNIPVLGV
ncbi:MAG: AAA family ATPase, partial [Desulfobacterales bacterium]